MPIPPSRPKGTPVDVCRTGTGWRNVCYRDGVNEISRGTRPSGQHLPLDGHDHVHHRWCGHPAVTHQDHVDYLHDGRVHRPCSDHVDEAPDCSEPVGTAHLPHAAHMHVHTPECGHQAVAHGGHDDYLHGRHRHAAHETHYDEH